jgi:hypothetical protein
VKVSRDTDNVNVADLILIPVQGLADGIFRPGITKFMNSRLVEDYGFVVGRKVPGKGTAGNELHAVVFEIVIVHAELAEGIVLFRVDF